MILVTTATKWFLLIADSPGLGFSISPVAKLGDSLAVAACEITPLSIWNVRAILADEKWSVWNCLIWSWWTQILKMASTIHLSFDFLPIKGDTMGCTSPMASGRISRGSSNHFAAMVWFKFPVALGVPPQVFLGLLKNMMSASSGWIEDRHPKACWDLSSSTSVHRHHHVYLLHMFSMFKMRLPMDVHPIQSLNGSR